MRTLAFVAALLVMTAALPAHAARCSIPRAQPLRFGAYEPRNLQGLSMTTNVMVQCSQVQPGDVVSVQIDRGAGGSGWNRRMRGPGGATLSFQLYLDPQLTQIWGDGTGGTSVWRPTAALKNGAQKVNVYGHIPAGQYVPAGAYADTLVVTVVF